CGRSSRPRGSSVPSIPTGVRPTWPTDEARGQVDTTRGTQRHRTVQQLGVTRIPAYLPEARGRSERAFRTLQDRWPQELALAGITERAAANPYVVMRSLPGQPTRCGARPKLGPPASHGSAHTSPSSCVCTRSGSWQGPDGAVSGHDPADPADPTPVP
ncbi:MAG: hypothetical protein ABI988_12510, partial [Nitrospirota bacterium]